MSFAFACCSVLVLTGCAMNTEPLHAFNNYQAMKFANVVQQRQDFSCGAAAVATLLTSGLGEQTSEDEILRWASTRWDLARISQRGFNLFQLVQYVRAQDFQAVGARIDYNVLKSLPDPVIVHMDVLGFAHFAVLRGIQADRVYLADSSFGNITMPVHGFLRMWLTHSEKGGDDGGDEGGDAAASKGTILAVGNNGGRSDRLRIKDNEDLTRLSDIEDFTLRLGTAREGSRQALP